MFEEEAELPASVTLKSRTRANKEVDQKQNQGSEEQKFSNSLYDEWKQLTNSLL